MFSISQFRVLCCTILKILVETQDILSLMEWCFYYHYMYFFHLSVFGACGCPTHSESELYDILFNLAPLFCAIITRATNQFVNVFFL